MPILRKSNLDIKVISIKSILFIIAVLFVLKLFEKTIYKIDKIDSSKKYSIYNLVRYFTIFISILTGFSYLDLSVLVPDLLLLLVED
jgi:small-conductance mechanosensitive channel